jgi:hypothetical protein
MARLTTHLRDMLVRKVMQNADLQDKIDRAEEIFKNHLLFHLRSAIPFKVTPEMLPYLHTNYYVSVLTGDSRYADTIRLPEEIVFDTSRKYVLKEMPELIQTTYKVFKAAEDELKLLRNETERFFNQFKTIEQLIKVTPEAQKLLDSINIAATNEVPPRDKVAATDNVRKYLSVKE